MFRRTRHLQFISRLLLVVISGNLLGESYLLANQTPVALANYQAVLAELQGTQFAGSPVQPLLSLVTAAKNGALFPVTLNSVLNAQSVYTPLAVALYRTLLWGAASASASAPSLRYPFDLFYLGAAGNLSNWLPDAGLSNITASSPFGSNYQVLLGFLDPSLVVKQQPGNTHTAAVFPNIALDMPNNGSLLIKSDLNKKDQSFCTALAAAYDGPTNNANAAATPINAVWLGAVCTQDTDCCGTNICNLNLGQAAPPNGAGLPSTPISYGICDNCLIANSSCAAATANGSKCCAGTVCENDICTVPCAANGQACNITPNDNPTLPNCCATPGITCNTTVTPVPICCIVAGNLTTCTQDSDCCPLLGCNSGTCCSKDGLDCSATPNNCCATPGFTCGTSRTGNSNVCVTATGPCKNSSACSSNTVCDLDATPTPVCVGCIPENHSCAELDGGCCTGLQCNSTLKICIKSDGQAEGEPCPGGIGDCVQDDQNPLVCNVNQTPATCQKCGGFNVATGVGTTCSTDAQCCQTEADGTVINMRCDITQNPQTCCKAVRDPLNPNESYAPCTTVAECCSGGTLGEVQCSVTPDSNGQAVCNYKCLLVEQICQQEVAVTATKTITTGTQITDSPNSITTTDGDTTTITDVTITVTTITATDGNLTVTTGNSSTSDNPFTTTDSSVTFTGSTTNGGSGGTITIDATTTVGATITSQSGQETNITGGTTSTFTTTMNGSAETPATITVTDAETSTTGGTVSTSGPLTTVSGGTTTITSGTATVTGVTATMAVSLPCCSPNYYPDAPAQDFNFSCALPTNGTAYMCISQLEAPGDSCSSSLECAGSEAGLAKCDDDSCCMLDGGSCVHDADCCGSLNCTAYSCSNLDTGLESAGGATLMALIIYRVIAHLVLQRVKNSMKDYMFENITKLMKALGATDEQLAEIQKTYDPQIFSHGASATDRATFCDELVAAVMTQANADDKSVLAAAVKASGSAEAFEQALSKALQVLIQETAGEIHGIPSVFNVWNNLKTLSVRKALVVNLDNMGFTEEVMGDLAKAKNPADAAAVIIATLMGKAGDAIVERTGKGITFAKNFLSSIAARASVALGATVKAAADVLVATGSDPVAAATMRAAATGMGAPAQPDVPNDGISLIPNPQTTTSAMEEAAEFAALMQSKIAQAIDSYNEYSKGTTGDEFTPVDRWQDLDGNIQRTLFDLGRCALDRACQAGNCKWANGTNFDPTNPKDIAAVVQMSVEAAQSVASTDPTQTLFTNNGTTALANLPQIPADTAPGALSGIVFNPVSKTNPAITFNYGGTEIAFNPDSNPLDAENYGLVFYGALLSGVDMTKYGYDPTNPETLETAIAALQAAETAEDRYAIINAVNDVSDYSVSE